MKRTYSCPYCQGVLNPADKIVLCAELAGKRGLVMLSPQPGNYRAVVPPGFPLKKKDRVDFVCPLCARDLSSPRDPTMAQIRFHAGTGSGTVAFSKTYGQHSTYFISQKSGEVKRYGEDASDDVNFFGAGPED